MGKESTPLCLTTRFIIFQKLSYVPGSRDGYVLAVLFFHPFLGTWLSCTCHRGVTWLSLVHKVLWKWLCLFPDVVSKRIFCNALPLLVSRLRSISGRTWPLECLRNKMLPFLIFLGLWSKWSTNCYCLKLLRLFITVFGLCWRIWRVWLCSFLWSYWVLVGMVI